jgi:hypothetical protein
VVPRGRRRDPHDRHRGAVRHAIDVTLDELRIELIYPQDATAERYFRGAHPA